MAGEWVAPPRPTRLHHATARHQLGEDRPDEHHPVMRAGDHPRSVRAALVFAAAAWACPTQQSATVAHRQQRSLPEVVGLAITDGEQPDKGKT